jgi:hypothetical protein
LTAAEAALIKKQLERLLRDPEANDHFHVASSGNSDLSFSIVTANKLAGEGYTPLERRVLEGFLEP